MADSNSAREVEHAENKHAIVIGINEYENKEIPKLDGAENDATELNKSLSDSNLGFTISDGHFLRGEQATNKAINKTISEIFRKCKDQLIDLILFYFSGHGFTDKETKVGYIAPYDMDPEDPEFCGIRMDVLRNAAFGSKTKANVLMVLDCCYAGIVTRGTKGDSSQAKNIFAGQVERALSPGENQYSQDSGKGKLLIASSEGDKVSRERTQCEDLVNPSPHTHGAFSYHLIQGLEGGAADNLGLITFDSLKKYLEDQMLAEGKQKPLSSVDEFYRLEKIRIGKSLAKYRDRIEKIILDARGYSSIKELRSLRVASKNIRDLEELEKQNSEIPILINNVNGTLEQMQIRDLMEKWLNRNQRDEFFYVPMMIEQVRPGLYDGTFYNFAQYLSYDVLRDIDNANLQYLIVLYNEAKNNVTYPDKDSPVLNRLITRLKEISQQQGTLA